MKKIRRILVVDDEEGMRDLCAMQLEYLGHKVSKASNGKDALDLLDVQTFDLVLTDLRMDTMNGLELLAELAPREVPVVVMSGSFGIGGDPSAAELMGLGAVATLVKPFTLDALTDTVEQALSQAERKEH